jgi:drug/metabolite transporter (DMT)-like permease
MTFALAVLIAVYLACSTFGLILVRMGAPASSLSLKEGLLGITLNVGTLVGMALYVGSFLLWMVLLQKYPVSYIVPMVSGLSYVGVMVAAVLLLKETVSPTHWIGIVVILVGIVLMNL